MGWHQKVFKLNNFEKVYIYFIHLIDDGTGDKYPVWPDDIQDITISKRIEIADHLKAIGNAQFKEKNWLKAGEKYTKALRYLEKFEKECPKKEKEEGRFSKY